jgi:hypothetical protein
MSVDTEACVGGVEHRPTPYETDRHHAHPKYMAALLGIPIEPRTVPLCPTCHMNVHHVIVHLVNTGSYNGHRLPVGLRILVDDAWTWWVHNLVTKTP